MYIVQTILVCDWLSKNITIIGRSKQWMILNSVSDVKEKTLTSAVISLCGMKSFTIIETVILINLASNPNNYCMGSGL